MVSNAQRGRDLVRATFGGALYQQGRGFYSALELFAILRGSVLLEEQEAALGGSAVRVLPMEGDVRYLRPSHDHARRVLVTGDEIVGNVFDSEAARSAVRALLRGVEAPVPGRRREAEKMQLRHFYPYPAEAIHYDAVERRGRVNVERYQFRGAGGLAHKALRTDPDQCRLDETRARVRELFSNSGSAIGRLLAALAEHDEVPAVGEPHPVSVDELSARAFVDDVEAKSLEPVNDGVSPDATDWLHLLREGVHSLLTRNNLSDFDRIDGLMHWTPWCVAMHQLAMARRTLGTDERAPIVIDAGRRASQVRALARSHLGDATACIKDSLHAAARAADLPELLRGSSSWWSGSRSFFTTTLFAVGALNANTGKRHFVLRPQLLQTIVHALVREPISIDQFAVEILSERLRIVCDRYGAARLGVDELSGRDLQTNSEHLIGRLDEVGLLRSYSDSTLMVGVHE
jgi:hypothetical protein